MPIDCATPQQLTDIRCLISNGRHTYVNFGHEDLADQIRAGLAMIGTDREGMWGLFCLQPERRPDTLPDGAPNRVHLRGVVLAHGRSPIQDVPTLTEAAVDRLPLASAGHLIIAFADRNWIVRPLLEAQFTVVQRVRFYQLVNIERHIQKPLQSPTVDIRPAGPAHLPVLAELDAAAFEPIWHFSQHELSLLSLTNRLKVAERDGQIVGYAALALGAGNTAQLTRLAVCPQVQGMGIGRQLLADALDDAGKAGAQSVLLNTQADNLGAQRLYKSFGFRSIGDPVPIMTRKIRPSWSSGGKLSTMH